MSPTSRGAAGVQWWRLILRVLGRGRDFAADTLKKGGRALLGEWVARAMVLVQAVLGEEQPGKTWGSSFSIPTSGLIERGRGLRRERKRAPAEGRQLLGHGGSGRGRRRREVVLGERRATMSGEELEEGRGAQQRGVRSERRRGLEKGAGRVRAQEEPVMGRDPYRRLQTPAWPSRALHWGLVPADTPGFPSLHLPLDHENRRVSALLTLHHAGQGS